MGKELVSFYTQPHTGNLFIFPVEYRISDLYSFPITCILSHQDQLIARLCYYGYEQRNAIVKGDLVCFEKVSKELNKLLDQALQANTQSLARFDEVILFFDPKKCSVLNTVVLESIHNKVFNKYTSLILIFRDWIKRGCIQNKQYLAKAKYRSINDVINSFIELTKTTKNFNMTKQFAGSKNKLTSLQYTLDDSTQEVKIANYMNSLVDQHKLKNTQLDKTSINLNRLELITDFKNRLIQFQSYCEPVLAILNRQIMSSPKYKKELKFNVMQILSEANTSSVIHLITNNLVKFFTESNFITNDKLLNGFNNTVRQGTTVTNEFEALERGINQVIIQQTFETYVRELLDAQKLQGVIILNRNLKQLIFNKLVGLTKHCKESEAYKPWAGLSEFDSNESSILHDILYLDSISTVALTMNSVVFSSEHAWKDSFNRFKYYGFRNKFKVFKSYTKNLQTSKVKKPSEVLSEIIFMLPLKLRDAFIEDIDNGVIVEKISHNTVIFMPDILLFKNNKQTILDQLKTLVCQVIKQGDRLTVTLEAVHEDKNAYKFYIVLKSSTGDKLYFDFGYDLINAEATEKIMSIFNDVVKTRKEYVELICTVMQEFETLEKELELLVTEYGEKIKLTDVTGDLYLQDKLKCAIINIQQHMSDKLKLTNIDLTSDVLEKLKESLLVYKFVLNELYHRWYFLPADGPYDEMILPQDYPYADKPVNGINEHPFPQGADKATREIPVDINILTNVIDFCFNLWEANIFLYGGFTPQQAIKHFVNLVYEWLAKYVPTKIDKIPEYYPEDYEIYDNPDTEREDYWRLYRWIRWYAEAIVMNVPKEDEIKLKGNTYIKKLLEDLIKYFEDHHGVYGTPGTKVIDKIKGLRHKWLDKYNNLT